MRVTQHMIYRSFLTNLEGINSELLKSFERISSGKSINRPSDDPFRATKALGYHSILNDIEQYNRNINRAMSWMDVTETALKQTEDVLIKTQEIAISQASDNATAQTRAALAELVHQLKEQVYDLANTKLGDDYVFAGYKTSTPPFLTTDNSYHGDTGQIAIDISSYMQLSYNITGDIFAPDSSTPPTSSNSIFQLYDDLETALKNNDAATIRSLLPDINATYQRINLAHAKLGNIMDRFEKVQLELTNTQVDTSKLLASTEDADMAKTATSLAMYQNVYQATLAAMSKVIQPNLLNYLT